MIYDLKGDVKLLVCTFYPWIKCQIITNLDWNVKLGLASLHFEKILYCCLLTYFVVTGLLQWEIAAQVFVCDVNLEIIIERNFIDARTCANVPCNCFLYQTQWKLIFIFSDVPKNLLFRYSSLYIYVLWFSIETLLRTI